MPNILSVIDLDAIEARLKAATPGPWQRGSHYDVVTSSRSEGWLVADCGTADSPDEASANVAFIAHAAADIARLLAEVRRLHQLVQIPKIAKWLPWYNESNGYRISTLTVNGYDVRAAISCTSDGQWRALVEGRYTDCNDEIEARSRVELWVKAKGYELYDIK